jgi:hypothetical protein
MQRRNRTHIVIEFIHDEEDMEDYSTTPEATLRAKSELLAEFLGCEVDDAERLILDRVTNVDMP